MIINGRLTSSTENIRQYDIATKSKLELEILVLQDGLDPVLHDKVPAAAGQSKTIIVPNVISAKLKSLRDTAKVTESRKLEIDKVQADRNKQQDDRDKLQKHRDKLQTERDALRSRRDKLQQERDAKK